MTASSSDYAVGRGKPPVHSRFQKGQSGNPSGKPGPAKLAKQRFQRALWAALEEKPEDLAGSRPASILAAIVRKMALDAADGRSAAVRQVLSQLETESARSAGMEEDTAEQLFTAAEMLSLLQGRMQGSGEKWLEELLWPDAREKPTAAADNVRKQPAREPAPAASARSRNEEAPSFLLQGRTQGKDEISTVQICSAPRTNRTPAMARAQLMTGTASVTSPLREEPAYSLIGGRNLQAQRAEFRVGAGAVPCPHPKNACTGC